MFYLSIAYDSDATPIVLALYHLAKHDHDAHPIAMAPSAKKATAPQKTLLNFFQKTPKQSPPASKLKKPLADAQYASNCESAKPKAAANSSSGSLTPPQSDLGSSPKVPSSPLARKRKITIDSDDDEGEDLKRSRNSSKDAKSPLSGVAELNNIDEEELIPEPHSEPPNLLSSQTLDSSSDRLAKFERGSDHTATLSPSNSRSKKHVKMSSTPKFEEERYKWLEDVRDADGHRPDDPDYDPRTIYVPKSAWAKFTPFETQYWEVKQNLWNTVVFFKKGKFYELYENDAKIAHEQFDLKVAGGGRANMSLCGVPEMSFDHWASAFIAKGYKVARVDQAETALGKEMRGQKEEKIIRRELKCVLTAGTLTEEGMLVSDLAQYCLSLKELPEGFAACYVDSATGKFGYTCEKDIDGLKLETLLAQLRPREMVVERGNLSKAAQKSIRNNTSADTTWDVLKAKDEYWDEARTLQELSVGDYFPSQDADDWSQFPQDLREVMESRSPGLSAVGGLLFYLRSLKLDRQLLSLGQFKQHTAVDQRTMALDGQTLQNLEVFANTWDGSSEGTVFRVLNRCSTAVGKRLLRNWVAHPLCALEALQTRQEAVQIFVEGDELRETVESRLSGLPDVERMLSRVHAGTLGPRDFVRMVQGLERMSQLVNWISEISPDLVSPEETPIQEWMTAFDHSLAKTEDILVPERGVEPELDAAKDNVAEIERELNQALCKYKSELGTQALMYRDSGKEHYLIEVPSKILSKVPKDWITMGGTSKAKRFWSPEVKHLTRMLAEAQETRGNVAAGVQTRLYASFISNYNSWMTLTRKIAQLDCLAALARASLSWPVHCAPEFLDSSESVLNFKELRHPSAKPNFIPNDVNLSSNQAISLLTGANAAGKSTVLRMTGCAVLLAQVGCHVPASYAQLTPCDKILTRLGASDNIFAGKSTFHVELGETQRILADATSRSLVVMDELGRGGSSSDGFAIAEACLHHLATHIRCLGFFATHYAPLVDSFNTHPRVIPQRMAIEVDHSSREVVFLYKLENGCSAGSFGMNVARMCGVAPEIVDQAERAAHEFEHTQRLKRLGVATLPIGLESDVVWLDRGEKYDVEPMRTIIEMSRAI